MKPLDFNELDKLNQSDQWKEMTGQAAESIKKMQTPIPDVKIPGHVVLPIFQKQDLQHARQDQDSLFMLAVDGKAEGPFQATDLKKMLEEGKVTSADLVWKQGWASWQRISECEDLL